MSDNRELDEIMEPLDIIPNEEVKQNARTLFLNKAKELMRMNEEKQKQRFWRNKQIITSFMAGMAAMLMLVVGITSAVNPGLLTGTVASQPDIVRYRMFPAKIRIPDVNNGKKYILELSLFSQPINPENNAMLCDGRSLILTQYTLLFTLLGDYYGGNLRTYFNIPDLRNKFSSPSMSYYMTVAADNFPYPGKDNSIAKDDIKYVPYDASYYSTNKQAVQDETFFGEIVLMKAGDDSSLSDKFIPCEGQKLEASKYPELYQKLKDKNAEDTTSFTLPDMSGMSPIDGAKYYISIAGNNSY